MYIHVLIVFCFINQVRSAQKASLHVKITKVAITAIRNVTPKATAKTEATKKIAHLQVIDIIQYSNVSIISYIVRVTFVNQVLCIRTIFLFSGVGPYVRNRFLENKSTIVKLLR